MLSIATVVSQMSRFAVGFVIARVLGSEGRGQTAVVAAWDDVSQKALTLGTPVAVGYHAARVERDHRRRREAELLGAAWRIALMTTAVACALGWLAYEFAVPGYPRRIAFVVFLAIAGTPIVNAVPMAGKMILTARGQLRRLAALNGSVGVGRLLVIVILWRLDLLTAFWAAFAFLMVGWVLSVVTLFVVGTRPTGGGSSRELLSYGIRVVPAGLSDMANSRLDQIIMAPLLGASDLGIYAVAVGISFLPTSFAGAQALSLYRFAAKDTPDRTETRRRLKRAAGIIAGTGLVTLVGAMLLLERIYGREFRASVTPAVILTLGSVLLGISATLVAVSNSSGRPGIGSWGSVGALIVTLIGLPILLPILGVLGAAIVTLAAYSVQLATVYILCARGRLLGNVPLSLGGAEK